jgi:hypothetical protein
MGVVLKETEKQGAYAEIMHVFRYTYRNRWAPESIFNGKSRVWVQAFNDLVDKGFIAKRQKYPGYEYKWVAELPEGY